MNELGIVLSMPVALRGWAKRTSAVFLIQGDLTREGKLFIIFR
jgi:hypothetical protein